MSPSASLLIASLLVVQAADAPASMPAATADATDVTDAEAPSSMPGEPGPSSQPAWVGDDDAPSSMPSAPPTPAAPPPPAAPAAPPVAPSSIPALFSDTVTAGGHTSRPGATESAAVLPRGAGLLTIGLAVEAALSDDYLVDGTRLLAPDLTLRYAFLDGVEIRTSVLGEVEGDPAATVPTVSAGFSAMSVGTTVSVLDGDGLFVPKLAVLAELALPLATLRVDDVGVRARGMFAWTFLERLTLAGNLGAGFDGNADDFYFPYTGQVAFAVGGGLGVYGETYGAFTLEELPTVWLDSGLFYDVGSLVRLDLAAGLAPLEPERGWFVAIGASVLLPGHLFLD